jgi:hypothetical protein
MSPADVELYPNITKWNSDRLSEKKKWVLGLIKERLQNLQNPEEWSIEKAKAEEINGVTLVAAVVENRTNNENYLAAFASSIFSKAIFLPIETNYFDFSKVNIFTMFGSMDEAKQEMRQLCKKQIKDQMSYDAINTFGGLVDEL